MKRRLLLWLPFALCIGLFAVFWLGLRNPDDHVIVSQLVGKPLPEFAAKPAMPDQPGLASADFRDGKPRLLNVFASWCVPCVAEIPMLLRLKQMGAEVDGFAVHDSTDELAKFLAANGNPYSRIGLDEAGRAQMAFGSAGVPETFVVDGKGKIVYQHVGVVTGDDVPKLLGMLGGAAMKLAPFTLALALLAAPLTTSPLWAQDYSEVSLPDARQEAQALALMDSIRCVVCQGQPISGSNADLAGDMRRTIRERIAAGETPDQVRAWLISRYGDWVSFEPVVKGDTAPLWLIPIMALLAGIWLVSRRIKRRMN